MTACLREFVGYDTLALREDGTLAAWGDNTYGQTTIPSSATNVAGIAAGDKHSLAWRMDGTAISWGFNDTGQTTLPGSLGTNVIQLSGGLCHSLALLCDGSVVAWGNNTCGQINIPASAINIVSLAAGPSHNLALRKDGIVVAWGDPDQDATVVPAGLSNVFSVAAGYNFSLALKNDGTVVGWGENANGQTAIPTYLGDTKAIAAGKYHALSLRYNSALTYPVTAGQDLLVVYNTNSPSSVIVKDYYLAHRPKVATANVLGVDFPPQEAVTELGYTNNIQQPLIGWLNANPTKRPQYWLLCLDVPSRVNACTNDQEWVCPTNIVLAGHNVSVKLSESQSRPTFVTHINMNGTNDCKAYINKLEFFGTNYSPGKLLLSASAGSYGNTNYYFDDTRFSYLFASPSFNEGNLGRSGVLSANAGASTFYTNVAYGGTLSHHIVSGTNVAGFFSWGVHGYYGDTNNAYATNQTINFSGHSSWYLIETVESYNGQRVNPQQGNFMQWFASYAFGGTNYSNTPVGAVTHVDEPQFAGNYASIYFGLWAAGKNFAACAWNSRWSPYCQAVGDPWVRR